jgi:putative peptidoglycan lipid II flippase
MIPPPETLKAATPQAEVIEPTAATFCRSGAGAVVRSTWIISSLTGVSRILGLIREMVFGYYFGTSEVLSAFRIAFMVPNLARRLFGEGALSAAMIPILTENLHSNGEEASRRFIGRLLVALTGVLIVGTVAAELVVAGWTALAPDPALTLTAILLPYMTLICVTALVGGVLNVRGHFATPAVSPVILNVAIIASAVIGGTWFGLAGESLIRWVCYSVLIGGAIQLALTYGALRAVRFVPVWGWSWRDAQLGRVLGLMGPMVLGLSAVQINTLADYVIAYWFVSFEGERVGPAVLGYAQFLYQLPLGVFGIALATAIFPELSRRAAADDRAGLVDVLRQGVRLSLFIALPASVGLMFVAHPLVGALYQRGDFGPEQTGRVAWTLVFYAAGMAGYFMQHILIRVYYAMQDSRTPARVALCMVGVNVALNLVLVFVMEERGLALSTAVCAMVQVIALARLLGRRVPEIRWMDMIRRLMPTLLATIIMGGVLTACVVPGLVGESIPDPVWMRLLVLVVLGVGSYSLSAKLLCIPELGQLLRRSARSE